MNFSRIVFAGLGGFVAYFVVGFALFAVLPLANEVKKFAAVYRPEESMKRVAPVGMVSLLVGMMALATLYAMTWYEGHALFRGLHFGLLVGVFSAGSFMLHNYVSLNIGLKLAVLQAVAYFLQWVGVGVVVALIYRP